MHTLFKILANIGKILPTMARMHSDKKGKSASLGPLTTTVQTYMPKSIAEVKTEIIRLAHRGYTCASIGTILRDQYAVGCCEDILGMSLLVFMRENACAPAIPDDLNALVERANNIRQHLFLNNRDKDAKYRLNLINSRLHRLVRYYKQKSLIPGSWKPVVLRN